jgi:tRNA wybutosine-synthesizing protein 1
LLHSKNISTFLVTNAQFPEAIRSLKPVTQLYVSVDAPTKESLKRIDRPLFKDFWERYLDSLKALAEKRQRTVYRLTLVKGWNTDDVKQYADLINMGKPDFIEIKGVTYCGESAASTLTMKNVPWLEEVNEFVKVLQGMVSNEYEIASEHQHSLCLLLAHIKFKIDDEWYTFINYDKFHELNREFHRSGTMFTSLDYVEKTPTWALYGAKEGGFDPKDERHMRKKKKDINGC